MSSAGMPTVRLSQPAIRWEYRVAQINVSGFFGPDIDIDQLGAYLNVVGSDGWELVSMVDVSRGNGSTSEIIVTLKRPLYIP